MKRQLSILSSLVFFLVQGAAAPADVRQGLVSYWPLEELTMGTDGYVVRDLVSGNDLIAMYLLPSDVVPAVRGNGINLTADFQTYLYLISPPDKDTGLPISNHPEWTVMFWVNSDVPGVFPFLNDCRVFSESSSTSNNPLINLGTQNAGTVTDPSIYLYMREAGAPTLDHVHSATPVFDGNWHHVALTYSDGRLHLYIDGVEDPNSPWEWPRGTELRDTISFGAIVRQQGTLVGNFFSGVIDELAVWERALDQAEIQQVMNEGIQTPVPPFPPQITKQPSSYTGLITGDSITLSVSVSGTRPFSFQWYKNGNPIPGATTPQLVFESLSPADSGEYTVQISNAAGTVTSEPAVLEVTDWPEPDLQRDMLCYWPMEEVVGNKTPDKRSWYDMELVNLTEADLVPGRFGKCFQFNSARRTMLVYISAPGDELPIYQHPNFTISLWVNGSYEGQPDLRVFSEGSTASTAPLFNIGTHNGGADPTVDIYIRNDDGSSPGHRHGSLPAFDGTWHHIVYVQRTIGDQLRAWLYIDGQLDPTQEQPIPVRPLTLNTTTIGGILRANPSHWFTGLIDDVALWTRALSPEEIQLLYANGTPMPEPRLRPLIIKKFTSSFPAVAKGDPIVLRWEVSPDVTSVEIRPEPGDVTAQTVAGVGSTTVTVSQTTTYTLTISRGDETLSASLTVYAVDGVASGWALLDNFDFYPPGPLGGTGWWLDLRGAGATVDQVDENQMLGLAGIVQGDDVAVLPLGPLTILEGQAATLFFRVRTPDDPTVPVRHLVGLTDKSLRWYSDANGNVGPHVIFDNQTTGEVGPLLIGTRNGVGANEEFASYELEPGALYNVWIDVQNRSIEQGDLFSVHIQKVGETTRTTLFSNYVSDRDPAGSVDLGPTLPDLDKLFVATPEDAPSLWVDDFYLSKGGQQSSVPRTPGFTGVPPEVTIHIATENGKIVLTWDQGTLESAPTILGPWAPVNGATPPRYELVPSEQAQFFRIRVE